jgi:hypothetical protein
MKRVALCLFVSAFIVAACHSNNSDQTHGALAALKSNAPNQQYGPAFWSDEYQRKTDLWQRAFDFCSQPAHQDYANCAAVLSQRENSSAKRWLGGGTNVPFGLQPQPTGQSSPSH